LRRASIGMCLIAAALGFMLQIPATLSSDAIEHFFPTPAATLAERAARITPHSSAHAVAIFLVVAGLGPCVEEFFFRGALFGALRRAHGALVTTVAVSLCFAFGHLDLRLLLPLFAVALVLAHVRELSGSIWPGVALHGAFNAATLAVVFAGAAPAGKPLPMPVSTAILGCVTTVGLVVLMRRLALSSRVAQNARSSDHQSSGAQPPPR
jgi:membrane protease YdiL (CAAX protease family)